MYQIFDNRREAGKLLAEKLRNYAGRRDVVILALPRGGVPVAYEIASELKLPLDVFTVRKLGVPGHEEFAMGSIATGGVIFIDQDTVGRLNISETELKTVIQREKVELDRRELRYRGNRPQLGLQGKTVILVDDGLATGATMRSAVTSVRKMGVRTTVVAVPVCSPFTCEALEREMEVWCVCVHSPDPFHAIGLWYRDFEQITDDEVQHLLASTDIESVSAVR